MRYSVDAALVEKRAKCIGSSYDKPDCRLIYEKAMNSIQNDKPSKNDIIRFFTECEAPSNANGYYKECIAIIESVDDDEKFAKNLKDRYIDRIIPYVENTTQLIKEAGYIENPSFSNSLTNAAKKYQICDRILDNHSKISKRFTIDNFIESSRNKSLDRIVLPCCNMIDTYDLKPHAKMNVCLEEVSYLLQKHNINYKKENLVKYITEYFLTREPSSSVDMMNKYRMVLNENSMIGDNDLYKVHYFTEMIDDTTSNIVKAINNYTTDENKDINKFCNIIDYAFTEDDKEDLLANYGAILTYLRNYLIADKDNVDAICNAIDKSVDTIDADMHDNTWKYSREDIDSLINSYNKEVEWLNNEIANSQVQEDVATYISLKDCYTNAVGRLTSLANVIYPAYNANCMVAAESHIATESMTVGEFTSKKLKRLIREASNIETTLELKPNKFSNAINNKLERKPNKREIVSNTLENTLTTENTIDICVADYKILDEEDFYKVQDILTGFCKNINDTVLSESDATCYYRVMPDSVEIHVEDSADSLDDSGNDGVVEFSDEDKESIVDLQAEASLLNLIDDPERFANLSNEVKEACSTMTRDSFNTLMEVVQYHPAFNKDIVDDCLREFNYTHEIEHYYTEAATNKVINEWTAQTNTPLSIQIESYYIACAILEADNDNDKQKDDKNAPKIVNNNDKNKDNNNNQNNKDKNNDKNKNDNKDNKNDKDKDKKKKKIENPFKGIKLNDLKLYAKGLKAKMKDMSNKEKEWCRNIDAEFNHLYKGITDSLTNNRREAIIKGSVIPSFSRCVKLAITFAGLGIATSNPLVPAIAAVASLACSKHLNKKERMLLLDEIEVELEVLDKEIQMAESNDQTRKLRELLMYKKDLQRQYQRIRYNIRIGKDIMPGTATGMRNSD